MRIKIKILNNDVNNGIENIKEHYSDLRSDVQLATEEAIVQINEHNKKTIKTIDKHEKETIQAYLLNQAHKNEVYRILEELEVFHSVQILKAGSN